VDLSFLAGVQAKLPLSDSAGQLSTSAAVGLFWEHDLREPFERGNRFMVTFGADVFSLFSGK
jgi:type IV secretory pathway protease TraF